MANLVCLRPRNQRVQRCLWDALGCSYSPGRTCPNQHGHRILLNGKTDLSIRTVRTECLICSRIVRLCGHKRIDDSYEPYGSSTTPKVFWPSSCAKCTNNKSTPQATKKHLPKCTNKKFIPRSTKKDQKTPRKVQKQQ